MLRNADGGVNGGVRGPHVRARRTFVALLLHISRLTADVQREHCRYQMERADYLAWEEEQRKKKETKLAQMERLKMERASQLEDQMRRRRAMDEEKEREHDELRQSMRLEHERHREEERGRKEALKRDMEALREANEETKRLAAAERDREITEDMRYLKLQTEMSDKLEATRKAERAAIQRKQDGQEQAASQRPPVKRYLSESLIQKHYEQQEKKSEEEDARRRARVKEGNEQLKQALARQLQEKLEKKRVEEEEEARRFEQFKVSRSSDHARVRVGTRRLRLCPLT